MLAPRQWITTRLTQDPKILDLVDCFNACYYSLRQKAKTDNFLT